MFQAKVAEKIKRGSILNFFFFKNSLVHEILWKNILELGRPQTTTRSLNQNAMCSTHNGDDAPQNMALVYCALDTSGYKYILRLCNNYCFSTPTMVTWTSLNVALYVHCLVGFLVVPLSAFLFPSLFVIRIIMHSLSSLGFSDADPSDGAKYIFTRLPSSTG